MSHTEPAASLLERKRLGELRRRLFGVDPPDIRVARYVIEGLAGQGAFGSVYRGYDPELQRIVALKILREGRLPGAIPRQEGRAQLLAEARALARFSHPNVVAVYDVGVLEGELTTAEGWALHAGVYVVMEFVEGPTLARWLGAEARPWELVLDTLVQAGQGLWAAHQRGLLHRDFKPQNVLVGRDGRTRVADFGLACAQDTRDVHSHADVVPELPENVTTRKDTVFGTPAYMSPEQQRGDVIDPRADQFAFCVSLFEALHGERPFGQHIPDVSYEAKLSGSITPQRNPEVPRALTNVVLRGLCAAPEDRFGDMGEFLASLEKARSAPRRRRQRRIRLVTILGAMAVLPLVAFSRRTQNHKCENRDHAIVANWEAAGERAMRAAFHDTGSSIAEDTYGRARDRIGQQIRMLADVRAQTCALESSEKEVSHTEIDAQHQCLDERGLELLETLRIFRDADAGVVERAIERLETLEPPSSCTAPSLRGDLERTHASRRFQVRWARSHALLRAGRDEAALALVETIVEDAHNEGLTSMEGEGQLWMGRILRDQRKGDRAGLPLTQAIRIGVEREDDQLVAEATAELAATEGVLLEHPQLARELLERAKKALGRAGTPSESAYRVAVIEATLAREAGAPDEALEHFRRADAIAVEANQGRSTGSWPVRIRSTAINLADTHTILGNYDEARRLLEPTLAQVEASLGRWHPRISRILQSLAFVCARTDEHGQALAYARRALEIERRSRGDHTIAAAWILNMVGAAQIEVGLNEEAVATHQRSVSLLVELQGPTAALTLRARMNLARAKMMNGDLEGARADARVAIDGLSSMLGDSHLDLAYGYVTLGETALKAGDLTQARTALETAMRIRTHALGEEHPQTRAIATELARLDMR